MHTPDMSDEELDRLFQRGAEAYPDEISLAGWLRLSTQLDEAAYQRQLRRQVWRRVAVLFLLEMGLVGLLLLWWQRPASPDAHLASRPAVRPATAPSEAAAKQSGGLTRRARVSQPAPPNATARGAAQPGAAVMEAPAQVPAGQPSAPAAPVAETSFQTAPRSGTVGRAPRQLLPAAQRPAQLAKTPARMRPAAATEPGASLAQAPTAAPTPAEPAAVATAQPTAAAAASPTPTAPTATHPTTAADTLARPVPTDSVAAAPRPAPADSIRQPEAAPQLPKAPVYRVGVALVGGPEAAQIPGGPAARLGGTLGVQVDVRLAPRWRVRAGVQRSVKRYAARQQDYNPPPNYWTQRYVIDQVDANCRITEIPLELRYDAVVRAGHTWYATGGVTSVLMRNERYAYHYERNGQYVVSSWSLPRGSEAAARFLRVGAGYEHRLNGRWGVQAEPFLNVPLGGVGFGKVRFTSGGLLLGLRYGLLAPRPAPLATP
ncbi:hypothetical protein [Hymenobacter weizhouensis]|uniref:hypothetical protein n=1 Tax=Hymenobacter sp. YIM 151500-1 TaxID=2987689 RepID=UPI002225BC37|nr:hypothetical protein [Hymenobacter sp. YIM 151500-1]UYZ63030.1 hypothetical protein OIS53_18805 [Hymenobacter sp. YIM 151500-1]